MNSSDQPRGVQLPTPPLSPTLTASSRRPSTPIELKGISSWTDNPDPYVKEVARKTPEPSKKKKKRGASRKIDQSQDTPSRQERREWIRQWTQDDFTLPPVGHDEHIRAFVTPEQLRHPFGSYGALYERSIAERIRTHDAPWSIHNTRERPWTSQLAVGDELGKKTSKTW